MPASRARQNARLMKLDDACPRRASVVGLDSFIAQGPLFATIESVTCIHLAAACVDAQMPGSLRTLRVDSARTDQAAHAFTRATHPARRRCLDSMPIVKFHKPLKARRGGPFPARGARGRTDGARRREAFGVTLSTLWCWPGTRVCVQASHPRLFLESNVPSEKASPPDDFMVAFRGCFTSALRWPQLDALWECLRARAAAGWYIYAVGESPPDSPANAAAVLTFIDQIDKLLRSEHQEEYCGIVYADDLQSPCFVKIYDPHNLGVSCGYSDNPPLPGWVMSLLPPVDLPATRVLPQSRRRWWRRLFS